MPFFLNLVILLTFNYYQQYQFTFPYLAPAPNNKQPGIAKAVLDQVSDVLDINEDKCQIVLHVRYFKCLKSTTSRYLVKSLHILCIINQFFLQVQSILALEFICFPSTTRASLKNGQMQLMSELQLGDQVLAGLIYTSIFSFFRKLIIFIL